MWTFVLHRARNKPGGQWRSVQIHQRRVDRCNESLNNMPDFSHCNGKTCWRVNAPISFLNSGVNVRRHEWGERADRADDWRPGERQVQWRLRVHSWEDGEDKFEEPCGTALIIYTLVITIVLLHTGVTGREQEAKDAKVLHWSCEACSLCQSPWEGHSHQWSRYQNQGSLTK